MREIKNVAAIYYPDGSSRTSEQVKRKIALEEGTKIKHLTDFPGRRDFEAWTEIVTRQQEERKEILDIPEKVEVEIRTRRPFLLSLFGDVHAGSERVDYKRFAEDVEATKEVEGFSITMGDLTDSYFFNPGEDEQIMAGEEQVLYAQSALEKLAEGGRLIAGIGGDHDLWSKDRMGAHTLYHEFHERFGAHYLEGPSKITVKVNDGEEEVDYKIVGAHKARGHSIYHPTHTPLRQEFGARGCDVSVTAHTHEKGHLRKVIPDFEGNERVVDYISLGAYKESDRYSRKQGFRAIGEAGQGGFGLVLHPGQKKVEVHWTIKGAAKRLLGVE